MRTKILFLSALVISGAALAEKSGLEGATKQLLKDTAESAAPSEAVEGAKSAGESLEKAKNLKESAEKAPAALKEQAQESAKEAAQQQLKEAVPEEVKQGVKATEEGVDKAKELKGKVGSPSKAVDEAGKAAKEKAKQEATDKALDLLR
jgi:hypothetical protein